MVHKHTEQQTHSVNPIGKEKDHYHNFEKNLKQTLTLARIMDSGQGHSWVPRKWSLVTFFKGLKRQKYKVTICDIGFNEGQS